MVNSPRELLARNNQDIFCPLQSTYIASDGQKEKKRQKNGWSEGRKTRKKTPKKQKKTKKKKTEK